MKLQVVKDTTSKRLGIFIQDSSSTTGAGKTGLTWQSTNLKWYYWRESDGDVAATSVTLATATRGTFTSGGFVEKDATNLPGFYEIGIPNAAIATGANWVAMCIRDSGSGLTIAPCTLEIQLMDALPSTVGAIADAVWDEDIVAAHGTADTAGRCVRTLDAVSDRTNNSNVNALLGVTDSAGINVSDMVWDEARSSHTTAGSFGQGAASVQGNVTGSVASVTGAVGSVTGSVASVTGAVGSVTGAVGSVTGNVGGSVASVTGNVGGNVVGSVASVTGNVGGNVTGSVGSVAAGGITATSIATGAIDADALATDAVDEIVDQVWNEARAGHTAGGSFGEGVASVQGNVTGSVGSVTGAVGSVTGNVGGSVASVTGNVGGNVVGSVASVTGNVGGNVTGSVGSVAAGGITAASIATGAIDADALATDAVSEISDGVWDEAVSGHTTSATFGQRLQGIRAATAQGGAAGSITLDASASASDDFYKNALVHITSGTGANQSRTISGYTGSSKIATITPNWITTPTSDSVFVIVPAGAVAGASAPTAGEVADAVWDEDIVAAHGTADTAGRCLKTLDAISDRTNNSNLNALLGVTDSASQNVVDQVWDEDVDTSHQTAGSAGKKLDDAGGAADPWGTSLPGGYGAGTAGYIVGTNLNATVSSRSSHVAADIWSVATRQLTGTQTFNNTGTWTGNVTGSVASVTGTVGSVTGNVGGNVVGSVASVTGNVGGNVVGSVASVAGNVGGNVTGSVGSMAAGGITAASIATGAVDADALAADAGTEIGTAVWASATRELTSGNNIALAKGTGVTGFNDLSAAQVNAEVLDVVGTDTMAQLAQAAPTSTPTMKTALMQLYMWNRNKTAESSDSMKMYDDAGTTVLQKSALSDAAGILTKDEIVSGP